MGQSSEAAVSASAASENRAARVEERPRLGPLAPANPVRFTFDGREVVGREGEPLLAALLAAGVRVLRTMPKTGEARGGYCLVGRCTDCLVVVDGRPNVRACVTSLQAGMWVETQVGLGPPRASEDGAGPVAGAEARS